MYQHLSTLVPIGFVLLAGERTGVPSWAMSAAVLVWAVSCVRISVVYDRETGRFAFRTLGPPRHAIANEQANRRRNVGPQ
jgi:hypothetical protein